MSFSFSNCVETFQNNVTLLERYRYTGRVWGQQPDGIYVSKAGCNNVCGSSPYLYDWNESSQAIATWVLPMLGMLLSAPFVSNEFRNTVFAVFRWVGSPIMVLIHILWNLDMTTKCCLWLDLSISEAESPGRDSRFGRLRDSVYILSLLNEYNFNAECADDETVLRVALFSDVSSSEEHITIAASRKNLADMQRQSRRKGIVTALISSFWFLFGIGITIEAAYTDLGRNVVAHNMALSFLLTWFPILVLLTLIDRNSDGEIDIADGMNKLINETRQHLSHVRFRRVLAEHSALQEPEFKINPSALQVGRALFTNFAGQGRRRWFRGIVRPLMRQTEEDFLTNAGGSWLSHGPRANRALLLPSAESSYHYRPWEASNETAMAYIIVVSCAVSACLISYHTPTVGASCRTGGYLVFCAITIVLTLLESLGDRLIEKFPSLRCPLHAVLTFGEITNTIWLVWIAIAQTIGLYETCDCKSSNWMVTAGYVDMSKVDSAPAEEILSYWLAGTICTCSILVFSCAFMVEKWCTQSHMSTDNYVKALEGLKRTRRYWRLTRPWRHL